MGGVDIRAFTVPSLNKRCFFYSMQSIRIYRT